MYVSHEPTQGLKSFEVTGVIMVHLKKDLIVQKWENRGWGFKNI